MQTERAFAVWLFASVLAAAGCEKRDPAVENASQAQVVTKTTSKPHAARARPTTPGCANVISFCGETFKADVKTITCYKGRGGSQAPLSLAALRCAKNLRGLSIVSGEIEFVLPVTVTDLSPLSGLQQLRSLSLGHATITKVESLATLVQLDKLKLHASTVSTEKLSGLTRLKELDLSNTSIVDLSPLKSLTLLERLNLTGTKVKDLGPLAALPKLVWLGLKNAAPPSPAQRTALQKRLPKLEISKGSSD